jgi:hypothetical protein
MKAVSDDTTRSLSFIGNVSDKPGLAMNMYERQALSVKSILVLSICFLAGIAAAVVLLSTLF